MTRITIQFLEDGQRVPSGPYPIAILRREDWDDQGYETTFLLQVLRAPDDAVEVGTVKIALKGMLPGPLKTPRGPIAALGPEYYSLGQQYSYYEALARLGEDIYSPLSKGLRDVALNRRIRNKAEKEAAFAGSLLASSSAEFALDHASELFPSMRRVVPQRQATKLEFSFESNAPGPEFVIDFIFGDREALPGRINVVIGYNGSGKTRLLANLAQAAHRGGGEQTPVGPSRIRGKAIQFGAVIAISYSAFDTFELPTGMREIQRVRSHGELFGYTYCGLRTNDAGDQSEELSGLKTIREIEEEFVAAVRRASRKDRQRLLLQALKPLSHEPSFQSIGMDQALRRWPGDLQHIFSTLSSGHKIVLNIVAQLVANLERRSLVLLDEPESHLHPPLLAALLKSIRIALEERDSFAIVATHSPVVLQEIASAQVHILRRFDNITRVDRPEIETFGENLGQLTREVFRLDSSATDYHSILDALAESNSMEQILEIFGGKLSSQARAYLLARTRQGRRAN